MKKFDLGAAKDCKFDLEEAKKGAPVCTRDGRKVRIVEFGLKSDRPILAVVTGGTGREFAVQYFADGSICKRQDLRRKNREAEIVTVVRGDDLVMVEEYLKAK